MKYDINDIDDTVKLYFNNLKSCKPLTKKEEHELLWKYKFNNDINARNKLINSNLRYACKMASAYRNRGVSYSDLISEANSGLIEAIEKFDLSRDVKLISYSKWWIMQKMQAAVDKRNRMPESDIPDDTEEGGVMKDGDEIPNISPIAPKDDTFVINTEIEENKKGVKEYVEDLMECLSEREYDMIAMYFGMAGYEETTLEDIGKKYNLTKERARQIIEKAYTKLRSRSMMNDNMYLSR